MIELAQQVALADQVQFSGIVHVPEMPRLLASAGFPKVQGL